MGTLGVEHKSLKSKRSGASWAITEHQAFTKMTVVLSTFTSESQRDHVLDRFACRDSVCSRICSLCLIHILCVEKVFDPL